MVAGDIVEIQTHRSRCRFIRPCVAATIVKHGKGAVAADEAR